MKTLRDFHEEAMKLAQMALIARQEGDKKRAEDLARKAYDFEIQAVKLITDDESSEPTRSILYQSCASLAYQFRDFVEAKRLILKGLSGNPPLQIEEKLSDLLKQVIFENNLYENQLKLEDDELEMSLEGDAVGPGLISYNEFINRLESIRSILDRSAQRILNRPYVRSGPIPREYQPFTTFLSVPKSGSFSITLKFVIPTLQTAPLFLKASNLIDDVLKGFEFINSGNEKGLREFINDEKYYVNFISLTRDMAPDGKKVKSISFNTNKKTVNLTRKRNEIEVSLPEIIEEKPKIEIKTIEGILDHAFSREDEYIELTTNEGQHIKVKIREGMDDVVRRLFGFFFNNFR